MRIEVGDGQRPGGDRTGAGAAAGADGNALRLRPLDEVGDDQEVAGEAHLRDDVEFVVQPFAVARCVWRRRRRSRPCGGRGPRSPWHARFLPRCCPGAPSGETGSSGLRVSAITAQRRAMARVLSQASGRSANSARMSAAGLNQCSGVTRRRSGSDSRRRLGDAQQRVVRLEHRGGGEEAVVGGDQRQAERRRRGAIRPGSMAASSGRPWRCSSTTVRSGKASANWASRRSASWR